MRSKKDNSIKNLDDYSLAIKNGGISSLIRFLSNNRLNASVINYKFGIDQVNALMLSIINQQESVFSILVRMPNLCLLAKDKEGNNALHWAARYGLTHFAFSLIACGMPLDQLNDNNATALNLAFTYGHTELGNLLNSELFKNIKNPYVRTNEKWLDYISVFAKKELFSTQDIGNVELGKNAPSNKILIEDSLEILVQKLKNLNPLLPKLGDENFYTFFKANPDLPVSLEQTTLLGVTVTLYPDYYTCEMEDENSSTNGVSHY